MTLLLCDWIMVAEVGISIFLLVCILCKSVRPQALYGDSVTKLAVKQRNLILCSSLVFRFIHYWCILTSLFSTIIVVYIGCYEEIGEQSTITRIILYSALSLFTTIAPYVVNLLKLANKFREAYFIIEEALLKECKFGDSMIESEKLITDGLKD